VAAATLGGGGGALLYVPPREGTQQLAARGEGVVAQMHMGTASARADDQTDVFDAERETPASDEPFPDKVSPQDLLLYNNTSRFVIGENGEVVLDSPFCDPIRMQLSGNGYLQVTCQDDPTERAALGKATLDVLQDLVTKVNNLGEQMMIVAAAFKNPTPATAAETGYAAAKAAAVALDSVYTPMEMPGEEVLSAALRISPKNEADRALNNIEG